MSVVTPRAFGSESSVSSARPAPTPQPAALTAAPEPDTIVVTAPPRAPVAAAPALNAPPAPISPVSVTRRGPTQGLLRADMPSLSNPGAHTWRVETTYGNNNNVPWLAGSDDDGPTFDLGLDVSRRTNATGDVLGVRASATAYIQDERNMGQVGGPPVRTPQEQMRRDVVSAEAYARRGIPLSDRVSLEGTVSAGVTVDGPLGLLAVQRWYHNTTGSGRPDAELPRNYAQGGSVKAAATVGGTALVGYDLRPFTLAAGVSAHVALGATGVSSAGPLAIARYTSPSGFITVEGHASARYQRSNDPERTSFVGGQIHNGVTANVGVRADVRIAKRVSLGVSYDSDPFGAARGFGPSGRPFGEKYNVNTARGALNLGVQF